MPIRFVNCVCSETGAKQWPEKEFLNPLKDPLPKAPSMKIYCMYGVGAPAERSYHYQHVKDPHVRHHPLHQAGVKTCLLAMQLYRKHSVTSNHVCEGSVLVVC